MKHPRVVLACFALALAGSCAGVAVAVTEHSQPVLPEVHAVKGAAPDSAVLDAFAAFRAPRGPVSDGSSQVRLERLFAAASGSPVGDADFGLARAVAIAGANADAWIAPAGDGVCIYLPDPVDGYGAGCSTLAQIGRGSGFSVLFGDVPHDGVMFAVLVADGAASPRVRHGDGSVTSLAVRSNLAAAVLEPTDTVEIGDTTVSLSQFTRPTRSRAVGG